MISKIVFEYESLWWNKRLRQESRDVHVKELDLAVS